MRLNVAILQPRSAHWLALGRAVLDTDAERPQCRKVKNSPHGSNSPFCFVRSFSGTRPGP
jgi:hypothetical protein